MAESARRIVLQGAVQGYGVRPALARMAAANGWSGSVKNSPLGVELMIQGRLPEDAELQAALMAALPAGTELAAVTIDRWDSPLANGFHIEASTITEPLNAHIPRDRAICSECLQEIHDPANRRSGDPFATCARCGPRYSILRAMPFDRERTAMSQFTPCLECDREYHDPHNRRYHAQTISCPKCGPRLWLSEGNGRCDPVDACWKSAAVALLNGKILALRGMGGYQLLADATASAAVMRLRARKQRPAKPFAVLCRNLDEAHRLSELNSEEARQLTSAENPIVLVRKRHLSLLCPEINPGLSDLGLMLPTTALHDLLLAAVHRPLICTSGNRDGDPLAYAADEAERQLSGIADLWLHHDRAILRPIDDSVVRVMAGRAVTLRAGRGIAPMTVDLALPSSPEPQQTLACGGQQKNSPAWRKGNRIIHGPHIGDLDTLAAQDRWDQHVASISSLLQFDTDSREATISCDHHPGYYPTEWAGDQKGPRVAVWHHQAHVLSGMAEHRWLDREVLGVAWDGTGLGPDGTIWGGEFLKTSVAGFERLACFRPFYLPGGMAAVTDVRRTAVAMLSQLDDFTEEDHSIELAMTSRELAQIRRLLKPSLSPVTTSCGRLFDAAACLILGHSHSAYEGQAAMCLESICDPATQATYSFAVDETRVPHKIDWRPVFQAVVSDRRTGLPRGIMAMKFHRGLANLVKEVALNNPWLPVVLQGGVFQNRVLTELIAEGWPADGAPLGLPGRIPPNDGGLAVGQLVGAIRFCIQDHAHVSGSSRPGLGLDRT